MTLLVKHIWNPRNLLPACKAGFETNLLDLTISYKALTRQNDLETQDGEPPLCHHVFVRQQRPACKNNTYFVHWHMECELTHGGIKIKALFELSCRDIKDPIDRNMINVGLTMLVPHTNSTLAHRSLQLCWWVCSNDRALHQRHAHEMSACRAVHPMWHVNRHKGIGNSKTIVWSKLSCGCSASEWTETGPTLAIMNGKLEIASW